MSNKLLTQDEWMEYLQAMTDQSTSMPRFTPGQLVCISTSSAVYRVQSLSQGTTGEYIYIIQEVGPMNPFPMRVFESDLHPYQQGCQAQGILGSASAPQNLGAQGAASGGGIGNQQNQAQGSPKFKVGDLVEAKGHPSVWSVKSMEQATDAFFHRAYWRYTVEDVHYNLPSYVFPEDILTPYTLNATNTPISTHGSLTQAINTIKKYAQNQQQVMNNSSPDPTFVPEAEQRERAEEELRRKNIEARRALRKFLTGGES